MYVYKDYGSGCQTFWLVGTVFFAYLWTLKNERKVSKCFVRWEQFLSKVNTSRRETIRPLTQFLPLFSIAYNDIFKLFDCLNVFLCHEVPIPDAITDELYQRVVKEVTYVFYQMYSYPSMPEATKVGIGFFLKELDHVSKFEVM